jgi:serine/threonine protein kinase SCH9
MPLTPTNGHTNGSNASHSTNGTQGIQINGKNRRKETPLTSSVQENFRGFTYSGGESLKAPARLMERREENEDVVDDDEDQDVTTEDEFEDFSSSVGRYSKRHGHRLVDDDDMNA